MQGAQVQSLVGELRSHTPHNLAKKKRKENYRFTVLEVRCPKIKFSRAVSLLEALGVGGDLPPSLVQLLEIADILGGGHYLHPHPGSVAPSNHSL